MSFKFNYKYYLCVFYKNNIDPCLSFKLVNKLAPKFINSIAAYKNNIYYIEKL